VLLRGLGEGEGVSNLLVECGPVLLGSLFEADLVDEALVYVAPMLLGDEQALAAATGMVAESLRHARRLSLLRAKPLAGDVELLYRRPQG
jgi:diaminohydroxyphosphoribosylaminopyrimidine deaminase / 5-amino-6-(5-phosphoribosylamino)uracil reductase